jgi:uncharacterized pyridoxamine 5'-phosphate oxidase family protein
MNKGGDFMTDILRFFGDCEIFYLSTLDGNKPQIRPMRCLLEVDGKLSFCTGIQKDVFKQMRRNDKVTICCTNKEGDWLRIAGKIFFNKTPEARQKCLDASHYLVKTYKGKYELLVVCSFESAIAEYHPFGDKKPDNTWMKKSDSETGVCYCKTIK